MVSLQIDRGRLIFKVKFFLFQERRDSIKHEVQPSRKPSMSTPVRTVQSPAIKPIKTEVAASPSQSKSKSQTSSDQSAESILWVDKYRPTCMKNIIGQTGDKSNARKLLSWLNCWHKNRTLGKKPACKLEHSPRNCM